MGTKRIKFRVVCGVNAVAAAMESEGGVYTVVHVSEGSNPRVLNLVECARRRNIDIKQIERNELTHLCATDRHQGVAAYTEAVVHKGLKAVLQEHPPGERFFLLLDGVTDPHNFGALIRSAAAAGCQAVIYTKDRSCQVTPVVEKAAAGSVDNITLCQVTNLTRTIETLKSEDVWVYGLAMENATSIYTASLNGDVALVAGSEGSGLRPGVIKACDAVIRIPMPGKIESLNVSVAAGIALFEAVRQRLEAKKCPSVKKPKENG